MFLFSLYLCTFADHFTNNAFGNYMLYMFPYDSSMPTILLIIGGISSFASSMLQMWLLEKYGRRWYRILPIMDLIINGSCTLMWAFLPVDGAISNFFWILSNFLSNILTSELFVPFYINIIYEKDDKKKLLANAGALAFQCFSSILAVIFPIMNVGAMPALLSSTGICLVVSLIDYIILGYFPPNLDEPNRQQDIETPKQNMKIESSVKQRLIQVLRKPCWIVTALFILFRTTLTGLVSYDSYVRIDHDYHLSVKSFSVLQLIFTISTVAMGMLITMPLSLVNYNDIKIGILTILSVILATLYNKVELAGLYNVSLLVGSYFVFDYCIQVLVLTRIADFTSLQDEKFETKILTITLSLGYLGSVIGNYLSSLNRLDIEVSIESVVGILALVILGVGISNKHKS